MITIILVVADAAILIPPALIFTYLAALSVLALVERRRPLCRARRLRRFCIVIPARDEEPGIARTVASALHVRYPAGLFDVVVVADNCADRTAGVARAAGACVFERNDALHRGKGYALRWIFNMVAAPASGYEAIAVVDADTIVAANFLAVMNAYLEGGARAVQATDVVDCPVSGWMSDIVGIAVSLYNVVRPLGRRALRLSAGLRGNGMCFESALLREIPWNAYTQTEDVEYGFALAQRGITVVFAPETSVVGAIPAQSRNAESQRARWEIGRYSVIRAFVPVLARSAIRERSLIQIDALAELLIPPLANLVGVTTLLALFTWLLVYAGVDALKPVGAGWTIALGLAGIHIVIGLIAVRAGWKTFVSLARAPVYLLWKLKLYGKVLSSGHTEEWVRTARDAERSPSS